LIPGAIEKILSDANDLSAKFQLKASKDPSFHEKSETLFQSIGTMTTFLSNLRALICEMDELDPGLVTKDTIKHVETVISQASSHQYGMKDMLKRYKPLLE
jgi:hypothetical protein